MEFYRGRGRDDERTRRLFWRVKKIAYDIMGYQRDYQIYLLYFAWNRKTQDLKWFKLSAKMERWEERFSKFDREHNIETFQLTVRKKLYEWDIFGAIKNAFGPELEDMASEGYWVDSDERVEPARRQLREKFDEELDKAMARGVVGDCKGASFVWACKKRVAEKIESLARSGVELSQENIAAIESAFPEYCEEKREKCEKYSREWGFFNDYQSAQFLPIAEYA